MDTTPALPPCFGFRKIESEIRSHPQLTCVDETRDGQFLEISRGDGRWISASFSMSTCSEWPEGFFHCLEREAMHVAVFRFM